MDARDRTIYYTNMYLKKKKGVEATTVQIREIWGEIPLDWIAPEQFVPQNGLCLGKGCSLELWIMAAIGMKCLFP